MKTGLGLFSKSVYFSLLSGSLICALTLSMSIGSLRKTNRDKENELKTIAHQLAHQYLLIQNSSKNSSNPLLLKEALGKALSHPRIESATIVSAKRETFTQGKHDGAKVDTNLRKIELPLIDPFGEKVGTVSLEILPQQSRERSSGYAKVTLMGLTTFLLGFWISWRPFKQKEKFLVSLEKAVKELNEGQFDEIPLVIPENSEWKNLAQTFNKMVEGVRERDRMRHSLGRIMDPKIAEILIKENPKLGGLRRKATILFCDIRNYTSICEAMSVDELQEFLNEYWKGTVEIIMDQEGTIDKFHGDGICVIFGAPALHEDDPLRAVRTAWNLIKNVEELNQRREEKRKIPIQIGIGIHSGEVIAGNIGSERRMDYTVVGDVVNVAARIEELNKKYGTKILISDKVYEQVEHSVRVKTLSLAHLRGHKRPILVHALREFFDSPGQNKEEKAA